MARDFARDCARLMEVAASDLPPLEFREIAKRHVMRTLLPAHHRASAERSRLEKAPADGNAKERLNELERVLAQYEPPSDGGWNPYWPSIPKVSADLDLLRGFLLARILPRIDHSFTTASGIDVEVVEGVPMRLTDGLPIDPRTASPFSFIDAEGEPVSVLTNAFGEPEDLRDGLFRREPALAVNGVILTLHYAPWGRCLQCRRIFACGRRGSRFCSAPCGLRHAYRERVAKRKNESRAEALARKLEASERSRLYYQARKDPEWVRKRKPGAGRPKKSTE